MILLRLFLKRIIISLFVNISRTIFIDIFSTRIIRIFTSRIKWIRFLRFIHARISLEGIHDLSSWIIGSIENIFEIVLCWWLFSRNLLVAIFGFVYTLVKRIIALLFLSRLLWLLLRYNVLGSFRIIFFKVYLHLLFWLFVRACHVFAYADWFLFIGFICFVHGGKRGKSLRIYFTSKFIIKKILLVLVIIFPLNCSLVSPVDILW